MIKVGTSGFSFPDWRGTVYPKKLKPADALSYYQDELGFDCVEINSTYYTLVSAQSFAGMEKKTHEGFLFTVKAFRGITHDPFDGRLKEKKPSLALAKENIKKFLYSLAPLREKEKLGAVLLQFPVFFHPTQASKEYLVECKESFKGVPLVIEFRNNAWAQPATFTFLEGHALGYCVVDEPQLPRLMPFINKATSEIGYLRLHGRNKNWFNAPASERYDYLYSDKELESFLPEVEKLAKGPKVSYVFFNNCHAGSAVKNAKTMKAMLGIKSAASGLF